MRIGIVGTGIAGLCAGWLFRRAGCHVTLFEKQKSLGMEAHSVTIDLDASQQTIDVPPRMFNPQLWPQLSELYNELGVEVVTAEPSKTFCGSSLDSYLKLGSSFIPRLSTGYLLYSNVRKIASDTARLMKQARKDVASDNQLNTKTFGEYLRDNGYSDEFVFEFLFPSLSSTVCTCSYDALQSYPAETLLKAMLDISSDRGLFRTRFGTADVVARLARENSDERLEIHLGTSVTDVHQDGKSVRVRLENQSNKKPGHSEFDHFVIATQANAALRLLKNVSGREKDALRSFEYENVETVIHSDSNLMPAKTKDWSSFNFISSEKYTSAMCSIWMNRFCDFESKNPIIQTILPFVKPDESTVLHRSHMQRPMVTEKSKRGVEILQEIHDESDRRVWFCGSYAGDGVPLLEGGVTSSLAIAKRLGVLDRCTRLAEA